MASFDHDIEPIEDNHPLFQSDVDSFLWRDKSDGPHFRDINITCLQQFGPSCVSNVLAMLTDQQPELFQKPHAPNLNTQNPSSWSEALIPYGKKLALCTIDCRRLKHFLPELLELDDLFTISFYCGEPRDIIGEPDSTGFIVSSHIIILHRGVIFDSCMGVEIPIEEYRWDELPLGEMYTKRIFRVVPASHPRGLQSSFYAESLVNKTNAVEAAILTEDPLYLSFVSDASSNLWTECGDIQGPFFRELSITPRQQTGPTCVSNVLAMLTNQLPRDFQKPLHDVNTQDPSSWSDALLPYGLKLAYCPFDCRRLKHYLSELVALDDLFTISFYTRNMDTGVQSANDPSLILCEPADGSSSHAGIIVNAHIVVLYRNRVYDTANGTSKRYNKYKWRGIDFGDLFTKRIFRVVPATHPLGI